MRLISQENRGESQFRLKCVSLVDDAKITSPHFIKGSFKILLSQNRERSEGSPQLCWWTTPTPKLNTFSFSDNAGFSSVVLCFLKCAMVSMKPSGKWATLDVSRHCSYLLGLQFACCQTPDPAALLQGITRAFNKEVRMVVEEQSLVLEGGKKKSLCFFSFLKCKEPVHSKPVPDMWQIVTNICHYSICIRTELKVLFHEARTCN